MQIDGIPSGITLDCGLFLKSILLFLKSIFSINDLLEYYGKLELQEAKRMPKTRRQDSSKSQHQPARNQNQCFQGNQNQRNENNHCNEEPFCS
jgi:hypothetical protein